MIQRPLVLLAVFITAGALSTVAQMPTYKIRTEEVRIDMLVTEQGKPIAGLRADDFEVLDNGVRQKIEFASFEQMPVSAILILDMSGSVAGIPLANLRSAGHGFLDKLEKNEESALITFGHLVSLGSPLTDDIERVRTALDQAKPSGFTSLIDACYGGMMLAESQSSRPLVVVFSDGLDTSSFLTSESVLEIAKRSNSVVYSVSAGRLPDQEFLRALSRITGGTLFEIESTEDLSSVFLNILDEFRKRYLLTYLPKGVSKGGWHELKISIKGRKATIKARPGYQGN